MDDKKIGMLIKRLRENKSKSQQQLADDLHVSRTLVTKWEGGKTALTTQNLKSLSEYFCLSTDEILAGEEKNVENAQMIENIKYELYDRNNLLKKKIKTYFSVIIVILFLFFVYFFVTFYNSVKVYTINVEEGNNIAIKNGLLVKTRDKIYLRLEPTLLNQSTDIESLRLYYQFNGETKNILKLDGFYSISINDFYEEQEYFDFNKFDYIKSNLYVSIIYNDKVEENVNLKLKRDYVNSKLFFIKKSVSKDKIEETLPTKDLLTDIMEKNFEKDFLVDYKGIDYSVHFLDSQIYIVYEFDNRKEKIVYDTFDGIYFSRESEGKTMYSYNFKDGVCALNNCDDYEIDYKLFLDILEITNGM